jgi:hypothetical protein
MMGWLGQENWMSSLACLSVFPALSSSGAFAQDDGGVTTPVCGQIQAKLSDFSPGFQCET